MMLDLEVDQDSELSLVELAVGQWIYLMRFAGADSDTYQKLLLPLDRAQEAEGVFYQADKLLRSEGEGIFLRVMDANSQKPEKAHPVSREPDRYSGVRAEAIEYLKELTGRFGMDSNRWRCDVIESPSIVEGVVSYAAREGVDIIVMNDRRRRGLAKLTQRSIAKEIQRKAPVEVRILRTGELVSR